MSLRFAAGKGNLSFYPVIPAKAGIQRGKLQQESDPFTLRANDMSQGVSMNIVKILNYTSWIVYPVSCIILFMSCTIKYTIPEYGDISDADLKPIVLSNKVGGSIDSLERKQFNLFLKAENYDSAIIYQLGKDDPEYKSGYVVEVITNSGKKYHSVNRDPKGIEILCAYLTDFEVISTLRAKLKELPQLPTVLERDPFEKKWHIIDYDNDLGLPITSEEVALYNKRKYNCCLYSISCLIPASLFTGFIWAASTLSSGWSNGDENYGPQMAIFFIGSISGAVFGALAGRGADRIETIKAIKAGRKLIMVE